MAPSVSTEKWEKARLIPVYGIKGNEEQERRAVSALLAVLSAVPDYGYAIAGPLGAPKTSLEAFTEVAFDRPGGKTARPDGIVRAQRGKKTWVCVVEVKTGSAELRKEQIEEYLDIAKEQGFDCVLTISNEIEMIPGEHPVSVDKRKLRTVGLHHLSWSRILTEATIQESHRGVADPEQAWILSELIRYLKHANAGAGSFASMGTNWVAVRDAVKNGTARNSDPSVKQVAGKWEELITFAVLNLRQKLGVDVKEVLATKERGNITVRIANIIDAMIREGRMLGVISIPNSVGNVELHVDLRSQQIVASVSIESSKEKRQATRVSWLIRQLKDAPPDLRVESRGLRSRSSMSELLQTAREKPDLLIPSDGHEIASFTVSMIRPMGLKAAAGKTGSFIESVIKTLDDFYGMVVQNLKGWQAPAPKLRPETLTESSSDESVGTEYPTEDNTTDTPDTA